VHPLITTWGNLIGMQSEFIWQGTMDYAPMLSTVMACKTFKWIGHEKAIERNQSMTKWCSRLLTSVWGTSTLVAESMLACMVAIEVPEKVSGRDCGTNACSFSTIHDQLVNKFLVEVPVFTFRKKTYVRVSLCSYNTHEDCFRLAEAMLKVQGYETSFVGYSKLESEKVQIMNI
jgi:selenocysteine lyase/cysteine desulfurase